MASGFFALLDDIGALMDDVALATKVASQKTAGILGDDLAVNAEKSIGIISSREIPVLWAITKGSFINKVLIIPIVFILNVYLPFAIKIILMIGGAYLAFESMEKIIKYFFYTKHKNKQDNKTKINSHDTEKKKIKDAVRTDFILSVEIVIIALSTVLNEELWLRITTVSIVAVIATAGVYGIVVLIVRMDDAGYKLIKKSKKKGFSNVLGLILINSSPVIIKLLSIIGTIALLMVAGGLFIHNVEYLNQLIGNITLPLASMIVGIISGLAVYIIVHLIQQIVGTLKKITIKKILEFLKLKDEF